jgi:preprotein translocase subunit SecD
MSKQLRWRVALIVLLFVASVAALRPRRITVTQTRVVAGDTVRYDTTKWAWPIKKGLDLQGGMHMTLEVDETKGAVANKSEALDRALKVVRTRIDQFGVAEPVVQKLGADRIIVELPGIDDPQRAQDVVQKSAFLEFQITDKTQALDKALPRLDALARASGVAGPTVAQAPAVSEAGNKEIQQLFTQAGDSAKRDTSRRAAAKRDTATASAAKADTARADTSLLGGAAGGPISRLIQPGATPGEYLVSTADAKTLRSYLATPAIQNALPPGKVIRFSADTLSVGGRSYRPFYVLDARPIITGEYLTDAKPAQDPVEGTLVLFTLNNEGGRRFKNETAKHIKDYMAIVLDQQVMGRPPVIQSAIGTRGQITMGGRDLQAAQDLALVLRAGALPVPLKIAEVRQIGASLGVDSIHKGIIASVIAIALVVGIMLFYYRFSGVLAVLGLALYVLYTLAALAGFDAVLTLPGLAGFVLSIGIAVDANVLIFERIREELDRGKTVRTAIDEGFKHALPAIVDSNVSTILTAAVLYQFGTGPVRGFAVTLVAGILASMVTAIFVVRTFYLLWLTRTRGAQTLSI